MNKDEFVYNNEEEAEMAQIHSLHINMNAVARVQAELAKQALEPSLSECEECGEDIPEERQRLIPGVKLCVYCKHKQERK
jgi:RNA polymerase-binding transcription factor DksA